MMYATTDATDTTAPATVLMVFSSRPKTIARPVTIPAHAAQSLRLLSLRFQSIFVICTSIFSLWFWCF